MTTWLVTVTPTKADHCADPAAGAFYCTVYTPTEKHLAAVMFWRRRVKVPARHTISLCFGNDQTKLYRISKVPLLITVQPYWPQLHRHLPGLGLLLAKTTPTLPEWLTTLLEKP